MNQTMRATTDNHRNAAETFQVTLQGFRADVAQADAKARLAVLFKANIEQDERLIATPGYAVKKGCSLGTANNYKSAIEATGAICVLVLEVVEAVTLDVDFPSAETTAAPSSDPTVETVLFQGNASLLKSALSLVQGTALGTNQKFVFYGDKKGDITLRPADILRAEEVRHGFGMKWIVTTHAGERYKFLAANMSALRQTMLTLTGQAASAQSAHVEPPLSAVRNRTAWLAAFGPIVAGLFLVFIGAMLGWHLENATNLQIFQMWFMKIGLMFTLMYIDQLSLEAQGFNTVKLGIVSPTNPLYLFSRAKAFGQGNGYAITWCVLFGTDVLVAIMS